MSDIRDIYQRIYVIRERYDLPVDGILQQQQEFENQRVTMPVIGKFSSGKTALVNTLLGYGRKLLREDITPETAVPTELFFGNKDEVTVVSADGSRVITTKEYENPEFELDHVKSVSLELYNPFLQSIPDVMLVDMPGFDSGYEVHNRAIDHYLPKSLAYLIAFSAEDMTLKSTMISVLKELVLNDMCLCIVITKFDKVTSGILEENLAKLRIDLEKQLGRRDLYFCRTSSKIGEIDELKEFLWEIQEQSAEIISQKYKKAALKIVGDTEAFLNGLIQNQDLTMSQLAEKEEALKRELEELGESLSAGSDSFARIIPNCIREIKGDLLQALGSEEGSFITMMVNGQDISERVNTVVRIAVTLSIRKRFIPKIQKHVEDITSRIHTLVSADTGFNGSNMTVDSDHVAQTVVNTSVATIGVILLGPILTVIGGLIALFIGNAQKEKQREAQRRQASQKLHGEVFPSVIERVGAQLEIELERNSEEIHKSMSEEIDNQYQALNAALSEVVKNRELETEEKNRFIEQVTMDQEELRGVKYECQ